MPAIGGCDQVRFICAHPDIKVAGGSTLFSRLLGLDITETEVDWTRDESRKLGVEQWGDELSRERVCRIPPY